MNLASHTRSAFDILKSASLNPIQADSTIREDAPAGSLRVPLREHQRAVLGAMERLERDAQRGIDCGTETVFSSYGILGDSVGAGKSLMTLGHIARLRELPPLTGGIQMSESSSPFLFSLEKKQFTDCSEASVLVIVPHTLFRQWSAYIKDQTTLRAMLIDRKKVFESETYIKDLLAAEVVLISNTIYKNFAQDYRCRHIVWKRIFIDEADSIALTYGYPLPSTRFLWLITASWPNLLLPDSTYYVSGDTIREAVLDASGEYHCLKRYFFDPNETVANPSHRLLYYRVSSYSFFRRILNSFNRQRWRFLVHCSDAFLAESIELPPLTRINVLCKAPLRQRLVADIVPSQVLETLHGGDVQGAIEALGVKTEGAENLIGAVTKNLQKDLERLQAMRDFKAGLEYSTAAAKEAALKSLDEKLAQKREAIDVLRKRIEGFKEEMCPICYDEPGGGALLTPCCSRIFCAACILTCLSRPPCACPLCRKEITAKMLTKVVSQEEKNQIVAAGGAGGPETVDPQEKKPEALLRLLKEHPEGRFLIFSRFDNPFRQMETDIESLGLDLRPQQLKGNKDVITKTLRTFEEGKTRCLLLDSRYAGAGLNITGATHVILMHAMTHEEEKQILGRAYRLGRKKPLTFYRLLHADELSVAN